MSCTPDLFADDPRELPEGVVLLRQRTSLKRELPAIQAVAEISPFRRLQVPGGGYMSVETTNAGAVGWCADRAGYRYLPRDPLTERPWPSCPPAWLECAARWAADAGFAGFEPDCCLINRYDPGARMGAHRDHDERDFSQPIVSVSLGLPATFVWYGPARTGRGLPIPLSDGDVLVFGGPARLGYHAVRPVRAVDAQFANRVNLTFRRAR
jgi:alkylated DNA repair protein (DNA oxidative demethylase)